MRVNANRKELTKLDRVFNKYIRLRDTNNGKTGICISCGMPFDYLELDCGHFVNRKNHSTRYDECNCNAQCRSCNRYQEGNGCGYAIGIINKYGIDKIYELYDKINIKHRITIKEIEELHKKYSEIIKKLNIHNE
jgi:hypothetical protein